MRFPRDLYCVQYAIIPLLMNLEDGIEYALSRIVDGIKLMEVAQEVGYKMT